MAFTTIHGATAADATSFIGSAGVDVIALNSVGTPVWLGAQASADQISFTSSTRSATAYTIHGGQGNDRFSAGDERASLHQSFVNLNRGNDTISLSGAETSSILGGQGDDTLLLAGVIRNSHIQANQSNDQLTLRSGASLIASTINGNAGDDLISVEAISSFEAATLFGGQGNDTINASTASVGLVMQGDAGNDQLSGGSGIDTFLVNAGDDTITNLGQGGADRISIAAGAAAFATVTVSWTATADVSNQGSGTLISGSPGVNINLELASGSRGWTLQDSSGDEVLYGSAQQDTINASAGNDELRGRGGDDSISGGSGNDEIFGNEGNDWIEGGADNDIINAGQGNDTVNGGLGNDRIVGGTTGRDQLNGGDGDDVITGYSEADTLSGGTGIDTFGNFESRFGQSGSSVMASGNTLTAGGILAGDSITFATDVAGNVDRVTDFSIGVDKLDVITAAAAPTALIGIGSGTALTLGTTYVAYGTYDPGTGTFLIAGGYAAGTPDALVLIGNGTETAITSTGYQVLTGLGGALTAGDFT